VRQHSVGCQL